MRTRLILKQQLFEDVYSFWWEADQEVDWVAGQYLRYILKHQDFDDRGESRFFSIASAPFEKNILLTTRIDLEKSSSFKKELAKLASGAEVEAMGPFGKFLIPETDRPVCMIAGGIGITPFRAILLDSARRGQNSRMTLLYFNRDENFIFKEELDRLESQNPNLKIEYLVGQYEAKEFDFSRYVENWQSPIYMISGPEPMVQAYDERLMSLGIPREQVMNDFFPNYTWPWDLRR